MEKPVLKSIKILTNVALILFIILSMGFLGIVQKYKINSKLIYATVANLESGDAEVNTGGEVTDEKELAKIEINRNELSVLNKNEDIQILVTLRPGEEQEQAVYRNPYIEIKLPDELEKIDVHSVKILNGGKLRFADVNYDNETKKMSLQLEGENIIDKTMVGDGVKLLINADLTFPKITPAKEVTIGLLYKNEVTENNDTETNENNTENAENTENATDENNTEANADSTDNAETNADNIENTEDSANNTENAEVNADNAENAEVNAENTDNAEVNAENTENAEVNAENTENAEVNAENTEDAETNAEDAENAETNENGSEDNENKPFETSTTVKLNSKYGAILYNSINGYNEENNTLETIDDGTIEANIDSNKEEKMPAVHQAFINNYTDPLENVVIVGTLANDETEETQAENINVKLATTIVTNKDNVKIYYSDKDNIGKTDESWVEDPYILGEVKSYKIELDGNLEPEDLIDINYSVSIPEGLENGENANRVTQATYDYNGDEIESTSKLKLSTPEVTEKATLENGIKIDYLAEGPQGKLNAGDEVYEGEPITYTVTVTNTSGVDLTNVELTGQHSNAQYYMLVEEKPQITNVGDKETYHKIVKQDADYITKTFESIKKNESETYKYVISASKKDGKDITGKISINASQLQEKEEITTDTYSIKDSKLIIDIENPQYEDETLYENERLTYRFTVDNNTENDLKDIMLKIKKSSNLEFITDKDEYADIEVVSENKTEITMKIPAIRANGQRKFLAQFMVKEPDKEKTQEKVTISYEATVEGETYSSRTLEGTIYRAAASVTGESYLDVQEKILKNGDKFTYMAEITNNDPILTANNMQISHSVTQANAKINNSYLKVNEQTIDSDIVDTNKAVATYSLKPGEKVEYVSEVEIYENTENVPYSDEVITNLELIWGKGGYLALTDKVSDYSNAPEGFGEEKRNIQSNEINLEGDSDGSTDGGVSSGTSEGGTYSISGIAWTDENKDGKKDSKESGMSNMEVDLIDVSTTEVVRINKNRFYRSI